MSKAKEILDLLEVKIKLKLKDVYQVRPDAKIKITADMDLALVKILKVDNVKNTVSAKVIGIPKYSGAPNYSRGDTITLGIDQLIEIGR